MKSFKFLTSVFKLETSFFIPYNSFSSDLTEIFINDNSSANSIVSLSTTFKSALEIASGFTSILASILEITTARW